MRARPDDAGAKIQETVTANWDAGPEPECIPGDANNDLWVDGDDAAILAANWGTMSGATWGRGDFEDPDE